MKKSIIKISIIAAGIFLFASCKKGDTGAAGATGPAGGTGPNLSGTWQGFVQLYDQYGYRVYTGLDSAKMTIGTTNVYTDAAGKYSFTLNTGTYDMTVTGRANANYGGMIVQGQQFTGGGVFDRDVAISQIPNFTITAMTAVDTVIGTTNFIKISGSVSTTDTKARTLAVFFNAGSAASSAPASYLYYYNPANSVIPANSTTFSFNVRADNVAANAGLTTGQTAYIGVYPAAVSWSTTSFYVDYTTDRRMFSAIGSTVTNANVLMP